MDFFLQIMAGFLILFSLGSYNFSVQNFAPKAEAKPAIAYAHNLIPAERVRVPYLLRGVTQFDERTLTAQSVAVADVGTGRTLFKKNAALKRPIASLTKLMAALVWFDVDGGLNQTVEIKSEDYREGSIPYFIAGEKVRAKDLLYAALIGSSNSAVASLVRSAGLSQESFVKYMNAKAEELGMKDTKFVEPTGLDSGNQSTAADLFILAREAFLNAEISKATQMASYTFSPMGSASVRSIKSTDWLLQGSLNSGEYKIIGGKTGYIEESNYNLVLKTYNSNKDKNLIVVILGSDENGLRFIEAKKLIEWAYKNYMWTIPDVR